MDKCPMFDVALAMGGDCQESFFCTRRCRFNSAWVVQLSMTGFKVAPRTWKRRVRVRLSERPWERAQRHRNDVLDRDRWMGRR